MGHQAYLERVVKANAATENGLNATMPNYGTKNERKFSFCTETHKSFGKWLLASNV